jgi:hypothetical protein
MNLFDDIKAADLISTGKAGTTKATTKYLTITRPVVELVKIDGGFTYVVKLGSKFKWTRKLTVTNKPTADARAKEFIKWFDEQAKGLEAGNYTPDKNGRAPFIMDKVSHFFQREDATGFLG